MDTSVEKPLVSVIMAAHNVERYIGASIESILRQTYSNWELIVVDDSSSDNTLSMIAEYAAKNPRIRSFRLPENSGQAIARNKAIELAAGKYLAVLDSDDIALPDRLEIQVGFLETHEDVSVVGSNAVLIDEAGKIIGSKAKPEHDFELKFPLLLQTQLIHSSVMMRSEIFKELGGYDTRYLYAEDYDLWSRCADTNHSMANIQQELIQFRVRAQSVTNMPKTQPVQIEHALEVNTRNIEKYVSMSRDEVLLLVQLVNNRNTPLIQTFRAMRLYRNLLDAYLASRHESVEENYLLGWFANKKKHFLKNALKRFLHI